MTENADDKRERWLAEVQHQTERRFDKQNDLAKYEFCFTPLGKSAAKPFLEALAKSFAVERRQPPSLPMRFELGEILSGLRPEELAFIALPPLLDGLTRNWEGCDGPSATMLIKERMGNYLYEYLALENKRREGLTERDIKGADRFTAWKLLRHGEDREQVIRAGHWLMEWCTTALNCFTEGTKDSPPEIKVDHQLEVDRLREHLMWIDPVMMPHLTTPPDWTGWRTQYDERIGANFVRDWQPGTKHKEIISQVFKNGLIAEHARGVNALQRVPFVVDWDIAKLVKEHGANLMGHKADEKQYLRDRRVVDDDMKAAKWIGGRPFYLTYNCDTRGRVYAIPHFNYGREDHVRALFRFANGLPLGRGGVRWLEINCANCGGFDGIDKQPWDDRVEWARREKKMIQRIAADPDATIDRWSGADRPLSYVAACRELAAAWKDPDHFTTHLPIEFDGSANGIQHLALLARDPDAARRVNLVRSDSPRDVYQEITDRVREALETDGRKSARWWLGKFAALDNQRGKIRKLIKTPAMTFAYNATPHGMAENIAKVYRKEFERLEPKDHIGLFLAERIIDACKEVLPKPAGVMDYICKLADHCSDAGRSLEWVSPTGFPVRNAYNVPNKQTLNLLRTNGTRLRHNILNGTTRKIARRRARDASAPNFVHSQDAAHLVRVVNTATACGITSIATVHDAFACLAPQAWEFTGIIREQLAEMYIGVPGKELWLLRGYNANHIDNLPMPPNPGTLDPREVWSAWWSFH